MKKIEVIILAFILVVAVLLRFPLVSQGFFAYTFDQGRDLLEVAKIIRELNLTLIGPTTGLPGIFYGPWWYYFLSPIFLITGGSPLAMTLVFAAIGEVTVILLYLLTKKITGNIPVALGVAAISAMSQPFITSSSQIWSPSLVLPLMVAYVFLVAKIFEKPRPMWFLLLGVSCGLIADSGAAFGVALTLSTIITGLFFRKSPLAKNYLFYSLGLLMVLSPRILFDLRNDFLISKSIASWLLTPTVYQQKLSLVERFINRLDLLWLGFAQTFTQSKKVASFISLLLLFTIAIINRKVLAQNSPFKFLSLVVVLIYLLFSTYPDAVWDYYLAGLPLIFLTLASAVLSSMPKHLIKLQISTMIIVVLLATNPKITSPFSITWQGDGAIYRNQTRALNQIKVELKGDYSLYVYTPARFDYPFDYLIDYYHRKGLVDLPQENQRRLILIIRDDINHTYLASGWYGDKVRDQNSLVKKQEFPGNIIVEFHERPF